LEIQAKFVREKHIQQTQMAILVKRLEEARDRHQSVQAELNEARDQNELLEFRILELEEIQERVRLHHLNDFECVIILVTHQVLFQ
jgi:DNA repair ATPase RecN